MKFKIKIGTRKSTLAVWQANWVARCLEKTGVSCEILTMDTKGDRLLNVSIPEIGSKGVFTEDLERELANGRMDLAVHSAKDMPSELPPGFELIAFTPREQAHDVLVSKREISDINQLTIGTSSVRRVASLKHYYPDVRTISVRGNLQTRIKRLESSELDAIMLAYAGVQRLGLGDLIKHNFPLNEIVPAVGQGSMAIEVNCDLAPDKKELIRNAVNHPDTERCILAERAFLSAIQGGCSIPAFAYAVLTDIGISIRGGVVSLDGGSLVQFTMEEPEITPVELGIRLARKVLSSGGKEILEDVKLKSTKKDES